MSKVSKRDLYGETIRRILYPPHDPSAQWEADTIEHLAEVIDDYKDDLANGKTGPIELYDELHDFLYPPHDPSAPWKADTIEDFAGYFNDDYKPEDPLDYWDELSEVFEPDLDYSHVHELSEDDIELWHEAIKGVVEAYRQDYIDGKVLRDTDMESFFERLQKPVGTGRHQEEEFTYEGDVLPIGVTVFRRLKGSHGVQKDDLDRALGTLNRYRAQTNRRSTTLDEWRSSGNTDQDLIEFAEELRRDYRVPNAKRRKRRLLK